MEKWAETYQSAIRKLSAGAIEEAFGMALLCRNILQSNFHKEASLELRLDYLESYMKTLLLFFDCSQKKGHDGCALAHLDHGFKSLGLLVQNRHECPPIRQKARELLKRSYEEMLAFYGEKTEHEKDRMQLQHKFRKVYFFKFLIPGEYSTLDGC